MKALTEYLINTYHPAGMILYGSYSNGTQNEESDFDALLICREGEYHHDTSIVNGVQLDVFIYSAESVSKATDMEEFIQIYDGVVMLDECGMASGLKDRVRNYVASLPKKTPEEKADLESWCRKMLHRASRSDAEGLYRAHWLLVDSLSIYCDIWDQFYFGPKKTILHMEKNDPTGFWLFSEALKDQTGLRAWIDYIFEIKE